LSLSEKGGKEGAFRQRRIFFQSVVGGGPDHGGKRLESKSKKERMIY